MLEGPTGQVGAPSQTGELKNLPKSIGKQFLVVPVNLPRKVSSSITSFVQLIGINVIFRITLGIMKHN